MIRSFGNTRLMTQTGSSIALAGPPVVGLRGIAPGRECCGWKTRRRAVGACTPSPCKEGCNAFPKRRFQLPPRGRAFNSLPPQGEASGGGGFDCGPRGGVTENPPHPCLPLEGAGIPCSLDTAATPTSCSILAFPLKGTEPSVGPPRPQLSGLALSLRTIPPRG